MKDILISITGASGVVHAQRLLQILCKKELMIHLIISQAAALVMKHELKIAVNPKQPNFNTLLGYTPNNIVLYDNSDMSATIASSSCLIKAMVILPCSMNTLCSIAQGISNNLIQRAAGITLKERRKFIIVPRETPLSSIHLEAMLKLSNAGAFILPAMPGFYHMPKTVNDQVDFIVAKILDTLEIEHKLVTKWSGQDSKKD